MTHAPGRVARGDAVGPLRATLALVRWPNACIAAAGVLLGAWWAAPAALRSPRVTWTILVALALTAVMNVANDLADVDIDAVAHPDRPLPSGALSREAATALLYAACGLALAASLPAGGRIPWLTALSILLGVAYSPLLKRRLFVGNLLAALGGSLPFLFGAESAGDAAAGLRLVAAALPLHLARELAKDVADAEGDRAARRTLPVVHGPAAARAAIGAAVALYILVISFLFAPAGWFRLALLPSALCAAAAALVSRLRVDDAPRLFKLSMLLAMAALPLLRR